MNTFFWGEGVTTEEPFNKGLVIEEKFIAVCKVDVEQRFYRFLDNLSNGSKFQAPLGVCIDTPGPRNVDGFYCSVTEYEKIAVKCFYDGIAS